MEFHAPAAPIHSIEDVLIHLGIVTIGILIALGLEQIVEAHHRAQIAKVAIESSRHEIADDLEEVKGVVSAMPELREQVRSGVTALLDNGASAPPQPIKYPGIHFNLISSASWETAIATQAFADMPYGTVKRYAEAYGTLHLCLDQERNAINLWQGMRRYGSYSYALELIGKGVTASCAEALK